MISQRFSNKSGMTLIEIMVVLAIISMVFGVSSAFFSQFNKRLAVQGAAFQVRNILRTCKNYATESRNQSEIHLNKDNAVLLGSHLLAYWHLESINEDNKSVGFGGDISVEQGKIISGKIGKGIHLTSSAFIDCGKISNIGLNNGFLVSFWVYFDTKKDRNRSIFSMGSNGKLEITPERKLAFTWGQEERVIEMLTSAKRLPFLEWVYVVVKCDGNSTQFYVNEIETDSKKFSMFLPVANYEENLIFGQETEMNIDEIAIEAFIMLEQYDLPEGMSFGNTVPIIKFNETGKLHPLYHEGRVGFFVTDAKKQFNIEVSLMGNIAISEAIK